MRCAFAVGGRHHRRAQVHAIPQKVIGRAKSMYAPCTLPQKFSTELVAVLCLMGRARAWYFTKIIECSVPSRAEQQPNRHLVPMCVEEEEEE